MNIWKILQIEKTTDISAIKKAYRMRLKETHPEEKPQEFMGLREAYEKALEWAESAQMDFEDEFFDEPFEDEEISELNDENEETEYAVQTTNNGIIRELKIQREVSLWWDKVTQVLGDYSRRCDAKEWEKLLYEDIPFQIAYYETCRERINGLLLRNYTVNTYLPTEILHIIDDFFSLSPNENDCYEWAKRMRNYKLKICEMIDFDKAVFEEDTPIDAFFGQYERFALLKIQDEFNNRLEIERLERQLKKYRVTYLPFECMKLEELFKNERTEELSKKIDREIDKLTKIFGDADDIKLLKCEKMLWEGYSAREELLELYANVPAKNYPYIFRLAICFQKASMYFEAYMLIKQLSWLCTYPFIEEKAEELYSIMEAEYCRKINENIAVTDLERIHLCRMYLRSNREKDAERILSEVTDEGKCGWHYHVAACLVHFNKDDIEPMTPSWEALVRYDKTELNAVELLEWEELQARYLFEHKQYQECIDECNRLLKEYPLSFSILTLRGYADYMQNDFYKKYMDFEYLESASPNRVEVLLVLAKLGKDRLEYSKICELLEKVKDKCFIQYEFCRIMSISELNDSDERRKEWIRFFTRIKEQEVNIPAKSKYGLIDLEMIYEIAAYSLVRKNNFEIHQKLTNVMINLENSPYNHPEKYMDLPRVCSYTDQNNKGIKHALMRLEVAQTEEEKAELYEWLVILYVRSGEFDKAEEIAKIWGATDEKAYCLLFEAWATCFYKVDEEAFNRMERYCEIYARNAKELKCYDYIGDFYRRLGMLTGNTDKFKKGAEMVERFPDTFGNIGIYSDFQSNLYLLAGELYALCGMEKEALGTIAKVYKYEGSNAERQENLKDIAEIYRILGQYDKSEECYLKITDKTIYTQFSMTELYLSSGQFKKAYDIFIGVDDSNIFVNALHARYMERGEYDREDLLKAIQMLERDTEELKMNKNFGDEIVENYLDLADVYGALGDTKKAKLYRNKAEQFHWNSEQNKIMDFARADFWALMYQKRYQEAVELVESNRIILAARDVEVRALYYYLKNKLKTVK